MGRASITALALLVGVATVPARRVAAGGGIDPTAAAMAAFCITGGFDYLITTQSFDTLAGLATWCPDGHLVAARALADSGLAHGEGAVREGSVAALGAQVAALAEERHIAADEFVELLADTLRLDDTEAVRKRAVAAIRDLAAAATGSLDAMAAQCLTALTESALQDESTHVRAPAAEALGTVAVRALAADRRDVAEAIFATLRDRTFEDREAAVRSATARALGRVAIAAFNTDESLAERCVAALSEKGLGDDDFHVRWMTTNALGKVAKRAGSEHPTVEDAALKALSEKALEDNTDHIKHRAEDILRHLQPVV